MKKLLYLAANFVFSTCCFSQPATDSKPPLPQGPIIKPLPELAEWAIVYSPPRPENQPGQVQPPASIGGVAQAESPRKEIPPRVVEVTKSKKVYREIETGFDGKRSVRWFVDGSEVNYLNGKPVLFGASVYNDFSELKWISSANYISTAKVMGIDCYIFKDKLSAEGNHSSSDTQEAAAAISVSTQLPVYYVFGDEARTYKFGPQPTVPLVAPPEVMGVITARQKSIDALTRRPQ
ncbi:MAG: hypothetical protein QM796_20470 [Chthoniobacteraceae bacterium]